MRAKTQLLIWLSLIAVLDTLPIPILALILFYIVLTRPPSFKFLVDRLYQGN